MDEGPPVEALTRRMAACPAEFLLPPRIGSTGTIDVAAVVSDLLVDLGGPALDEAASQWFRPPESPVARNRLSGVAVACWLLAAPELAADARPSAAFALVSRALDELSAHVAAASWVSDPDRREELARRCLAELGLRPAGESDAEAEDRLATLDSGARARVMAETRAAEERVAEIREAMRRQAAEEAAARAMRE